jgi:hypothetical protein
MEGTWRARPVGAGRAARRRPVLRTPRCVTSFGVTRSPEPATVP